MKISHPEKMDINSLLPPKLQHRRILSDIGSEKNKITTLVFDWGGVITPIDPGRAISEFRKLGHPSIEDYFEPGMKNDLLQKLEIGKVEPEEVWECLQKDFHQPPHPQLLEQAYCTLLLETPKIRIQLLQNLQSDFELYLLSNTNIVHTTYYEDVLRQKFKLDFASLFNKVFYSNLMGLRKPGKEIFEKLIIETGISPENTLFLDDTQTNIDTARSLGINSLLVNDQNPIEKIFHNWL